MVHPTGPRAATSTTSSPTTTTPQQKADHNPGPRTSDNLAALCRFHHRLKTHTAWRYRVTGPGCFEWTSPHGHHYRRDPTGTTPIHEDRPGPTRHPATPPTMTPPRTPPVLTMAGAQACSTGDMAC